MALDQKNTLLAVGAEENLVGLDFFGDTVQDFINHDPTPEEDYNRVIAREVRFCGI